SAIVVCSVTDPDGDKLAFGWSSDCRLLKKGNVLGQETLYNVDRAQVVYAGTCGAPVDTGWVTCEVWDNKGGYAYAGRILIVVRHGGCGAFCGARGDAAEGTPHPGVWCAGPCASRPP